MAATVDRRDFVLGLVGAGYSLLKGSPAKAGGDPSLRAQPWAVWDEAEKPVRGGYLRTAAAQYIGKMNPDHWPVLDWVTMGDFYEKLVITDGSYRPTVPWLLESFAFENPTTAVTKLHDGVTFQDGSKFDAAAVKFVIDWIRDPTSQAWSASWLAPLDKVAIVDELTLGWHFKTPWAAFPGIIANVPGYMISPAALKNDPESGDNHPVGTGPFALEQASPGNFVKMKRNPNWWFAKAAGNSDMPYFDGVIVTIIPDPAVRLANLRAGKIDLLLFGRQVAIHGGQERSYPERVRAAPELDQCLALQLHQGRMPGHSRAQGNQPRHRPPRADRRHAVWARPDRQLHVSRGSLGA